MRWNIQRITALNPKFPPDFPMGAKEQPYRLISIRRNEIQDKLSTVSIGKWIKDSAKFQPYFVDSAGRESVQGEHRTQRSTLALHHVSYRIDANPVLTGRANRPRIRPADSDEPEGEDTVVKYVAMFNRRVAKGQCFHRPYLGCREFACDFGPIDGSEVALEWTQSLGLMLYDIWFGADGVNRPGFFDSHVRNGVLHCDSMAPGPQGQPPVTIHGWDLEEVYR
jgi:CRISPR-associated protein Cas5d